MGTSDLLKAQHAVRSLGIFNYGFHFDGEVQDFLFNDLLHQNLVFFPRNDFCLDSARNVLDRFVIGNESKGTADINWNDVTGVDLEMTVRRSHAYLNIKRVVLGLGKAAGEHRNDKQG